MVKHPETGTLKAFNFDAIAEQIPELKLLDCDTECISFETPIDSSDIDPSLWTTMVDMIETNYTSFDGFVILHGSDTMSYSAAALSFMFENLSKPVIFTGSQLPIGDLRTDAKENLITSIQLAALKENGKAVIQEVGLYFEYKLYRGNRTTKINAAHFEAFESLNYAPLAQSGVSLEVSRSLLLKPQKGKHTKFHKKMDHSVGVLKLFPGISPSFVRSVLFSESLKAIVLETYGAGNAPTAPWFIAILSEAIQNGLIIVNVKIFYCVICNCLNSTNSSCNCAFRFYFKVPNVPRIFYMRSTTQLYRIAKFYGTYGISIFFTKQSHCTIGNCFIHRNISTFF